MKNYLKILIITLGIQIVCIIYASALSDIFSNICFFLAFPLSIVVDIILAIKWGKNIKEKLLYIFLMPTNYIWILFIWLVIWCLTKWMDVMRDFVTHWS